MNQGWIKLHRSLLDWEWYDDVNVMRLFLHCVLKANHTEKQWRGVTIKRGQFYTSLDTLSKELGLSIQKIRTAISKLESTGEITSKQHAKARMVTVINYDNHQADNKQVTSNQQVSNKEVTATKNEKNKKNEKKFTPPTLEEFVAYAQEILPKLNPEWQSDQITRCAGDKFDTYVEQDWCDGFGKKIKNWKLKAKNSMKFDMPYKFGTSILPSTKPKTISQKRGY